MIVYNITMKIADGIKAEWLRWQKEEHIPDIMATGLFENFRIYHLLEQDEEEGATFVIQYFLSSAEKYREYSSIHAPQLRKKAFEKWGNQITGFRTLMEAVQ